MSMATGRGQAPFVGILNAILTATSPRHTSVLYIPPSQRMRDPSSECRSSRVLPWTMWAMSFEVRTNETLGGLSPYSWLLPDCMFEAPTLTARSMGFSRLRVAPRSLSSQARITDSGGELGRNRGFFARVRGFYDRQRTPVARSLVPAPCLMTSNVDHGLVLLASLACLNGSWDLEES